MNYYISHGTFHAVPEQSDELMHYGVKGMRWGHRKKVDYVSKAKTARESAREWDEMARYAEAKGKTKRAAKYRANAKQDLADAQAYERQAAPRKSTKTSKSSPAKKVNSGKKKTKKIVQSGVRATAKTVNWGAQVAMRMMQNNVVYGTAGAMFDSIYDR